MRGALARLLSIPITGVDPARPFASYGLDYLKPERDVRLTILEAAPRILPPLQEKIAEAATGLLGTLAVTAVTKY